MKSKHNHYILAVCLWLLQSLSTYSAEVAAGTSLQMEANQKTGLTLSGGGARGLAHIGVLHVIDSLGLKIDYITGTSTGSIVGGMYASGYSAAEIEAFALGIDWEAMFSRRSDLAYIHPSRRSTYQQHIIELPIEDRRIRLATGAIEGQQLWNTLSEVFFHVYDIRDFSQLPIPFACVATNVENGEAVVMKTGNLVTAIRASMAIPSVFTTVDREGVKLIDGGVVNNFPTNVVKEMGAEFIIGVNVSQGLRPAEELVTPIDIIYQMGFYSDARSFVRNKEITDLFIDVDLAGFTAASFAHTAEIIELGKRAARERVAELEKLPRRTTDEQEPAGVVREALQFIVDSIEFQGLDKVREWFVENTMNISPRDTITAYQLTRAVNRLYASNYFNRVHYYLKPGTAGGSVIVVLELDEKPFSSLSAALHFSSFTGVGIIGGINSNRFLYYNTQASATVMLGEQPAFHADLRHFLDDRRRNWLQWSARGRRFDFPLYEDFEAFAEYKQNFFRAELSANKLTGDNAYVSLSSAFYYQSLRPNMRTPTTIDASTSALQLGLAWKHQSLNRNMFATSGQRIMARGTYFFGQSVSVNEIRLNNEPSTLEDLGINIGNFLQLEATFKSLIPLGGRLSQVSLVQLGYHLNYEQGFINGFNLGGTYQFLENQLTFIGLNEYAVVSESVLTAGTGYRFNAGRGIFATALFNAALYDFQIDKPEQISSDNFIFGGGASLGYDGMLGPVEVTFSYSPQTGKVIGYINLGWFF